MKILTYHGPLGEGHIQAGGRQINFVVGRPVEVPEEIALGTTDAKGRLILEGLIQKDQTGKTTGFWDEATEAEIAKETKRLADEKSAEQHEEK